MVPQIPLAQSRCLLILRQILPDSLLAAGFRDQFTSFLFNERLNGLGGGEPLGVLNSPCVVSVAKETGQVTKTIVTNTFGRMPTRMRSVTGCLLA